MFNQWERMSAMPEAVLHPAVAASNQRIYVFGGEDAVQNPVRMIQVTALIRVAVLIFLIMNSFVLSFSVAPSALCRCITLGGTCGVRWKTEW